MPKRLLLFYFYFLLSAAFCQEPHHIQYTTSNGLSSTEIYDVIQDDWGYLWISSDHGLNRFDGYKFEQYSTEDGLTDNTVFRFKKDPYGRIWCTTYNNTLFLIEGRDPQFIPFKYNDLLQTEVENRILKDVYFDKDHNLYVTLNIHYGYIKIEPNGTASNHITRSSLSELVFRNLDLGHNANFFVVSPEELEYNEKMTLVDSIHIETGRFFQDLLEDGIYFSHKKTTVFGLTDKVVIKSEDKSKISIPLTGELIGIGEFTENLFWVSTWKGGVQFYDLDGKLTFELLKGKNISKVYHDHEGGLWASTLMSGVFYYKNWHLKNLDPRNSTVPVSELALDTSNNLWVGYEDGDIYRMKAGKTLDAIDSKLVRPPHFFINPRTKNLHYFSDDHLFNQDGTDSVFVGAINGFKIYEGCGKDSIVLAKSTSIVYVDRLKDTLLPMMENRRILDFISIGSEHFHATQKGLLSANEEPIHSDEIFMHRFNSLAESNGTLIAGSRGAGVIFYKNSAYRNINKTTGLSSNFVNHVYNAGDSVLWVATNAGVSRLSLEKNHILINNIGTREGLIDNHVTSFAVSGDTIWIGTHGGLTYLLDSKLEGGLTYTDYGIHLSSIEVNDKLLSVKDSYELSHTQNRINFNFLAFSFRESSAFEYRYKLIGLENEWNYTTTPSVLYSSLEDGTYQFVVQYKGTNTSWQDQTATVQIRISPPFWKTSWFFLTLLSICSLLLYLFFKYKVIIYNGDVLREILRFLLKKMRKEGPFMVIKEAGTEYKIYTEDILFVRSDRNYLEIHTKAGKHLIREKIGKFLDLVPDPIEFLRIKRSYIIRIDKVTEKGKKSVKIGDVKLEVGDTYLEELDKIII